MNTNETKVFDSTSPKIKTGCGWLYSVGMYDPQTGALERVQFQLGKSGGCARAGMETVAELINVMIQVRIPMELILEALEGRECNNKFVFEGKEILSCYDAARMALKGLVPKPEVKAEAVEK